MLFVQSEDSISFRDINLFSKVISTIHCCNFLMCSISPNSKFFIFSTKDTLPKKENGNNKIYKADLSTGILEEIKMENLETTSITKIAWNEDSSLFALGLIDGRILVYDSETGQKIAGHHAHRVTISASIFTNDNNHIIGGDISGKMSITGFRSQSSKPSMLPKWTSANGPIKNVISHPTQNILAVYCNKLIIYYFDKNNKIANVSPEILTSDITALCFIDSLLVVSLGLEKKLICIDINSLAVLSHLSTSEPFYKLKITSINPLSGIALSSSNHLFSFSGNNFTQICSGNEFFYTKNPSFQIKIPDEIQNRSQNLSDDSQISASISESLSAIDINPHADQTIPKEELSFEMEVKTSKKNISTSKINMDNNEKEIKSQKEKKSFRKKRQSLMPGQTLDLGDSSDSPPPNLKESNQKKPVSKGHSSRSQSLNPSQISKKVVISMPAFPDIPDIDSSPESNKKEIPINLDENPTVSILSKKSSPSSFNSSKPIKNIKKSPQDSKTFSARQNEITTNDQSNSLSKKDNSVQKDSPIKDEKVSLKNKELKEPRNDPIPYQINNTGKDSDIIPKPDFQTLFTQDPYIKAKMIAKAINELPPLDNDVSFNPTEKKLLQAFSSIIDAKFETYIDEIHQTMNAMHLDLLVKIDKLQSEIECLKSSQK